MAVVTESFLPHVNGVTNSVLRVLEHLARERHDAIVIAPGKLRDVPARYAGFEVFPIASIPMPGYRQVRLGFANELRVTEELRRFSPDVVHLASPFVLGAVAARAAQSLGIPAIAIYQTDVPGFASRYGMQMAAEVMWSHIRHIHQSCALTLAPSSDSMRDLFAHGISRVHIWGRGVDSEVFHPDALNHEWKTRLARSGEFIVGYVGRLAREKNVKYLLQLARKENVRLVVIGDGPLRQSLMREMPEACFLGQLSGHELARAMASLDVLVHPGEHETFCQVIQEAMSCGVAVVAPAAGGPLDLVEPEVTGLLYPPGDIPGLEAAVERLMKDADLRSNLGMAARAVVERKSWPSVCEQLVDYYRQVVMS